MQNLSYKQGTEMDIKVADTDKFNFNFPDRIPIDEVRTLDQLTGRFRSVRDGLPELIKNSKDQYSRLGINSKDDRQIVVLTNSTNRTLAVLDFAGAPQENFEGWTTWSNPDAGKIEKAADIEAGHGNGGKSFMVRGANKTSFMESCFQGKRTQKGFVNDQEETRFKPGFGTHNGTSINDIAEGNPTDKLAAVLSLMDVQPNDLPNKAIEKFIERQAFTVVYLEKVEEWISRRKPKLKAVASSELVDLLGSHGQSAMTIETCQVWVVADGNIVGGSPVMPMQMDAYPGFEEPREFPIPDILPDPETEESVRIENQGITGSLVLRTSKKQLQLSPETKAKNVIRVWNDRNNIATWTAQELHPISASGYIYGELRCSALSNEDQDGATRQHLLSTPITRALKKWASEKVEELASDIHRLMAEKTSPEDQARARNTLSNIRELMRKFLDHDTDGTEADSSGVGGGKGDDDEGRSEERNKSEFGNRIDEIHLEPNLRDVYLISGTKIPLIFSCLEIADDGSKKPVRSNSLVFKSEPEGMFSLDADGMLSSSKTGLGKIWLETDDGSVSSNAQEFWAIDASNVQLSPPDEPLLQGQRLKLHFSFETSDGPVEDVLLDAHVVDPDFGVIGRHGRLIVGHKTGELKIAVQYGAEQNSYKEFALEVGNDRVPEPEGKGNNGGDVPHILLCGEDAPGMEEYPKERRTIPGGEDYPTVYEDPVFPGVVWINPSSKEALRVRRGAGGSSGVGNIGNKTFMHFIALKCFDILKRLYVRQKISGDTVSEFTFMALAVDAEMACVDFIDAAWDLTDDLLKRELASNE